MCAHIEYNPALYCTQCVGGSCSVTPMEAFIKYRDWSIRFKKDFLIKMPKSSQDFTSLLKKSYKLSCVHIGECKGYISFPLLVSCISWWLTDSLLYSTWNTTGVSAWAELNCNLRLLQLQLNAALSGHDVCEAIIGPLEGVSVCRECVGGMRCTVI